MSLISAEYGMKDLGPLSYFLGVDVTCTSAGMFFSQTNYATDIIERVGLTSCKPSYTPVYTKAKLGTSAGSAFSDPTLYRQLPVPYNTLFHQTRHIICCSTGVFHICMIRKLSI